MPKLTNLELEGIERALSHELPGLYRKLLFEFGYGRIGPNAEVYHPLTVHDLYAPFFADPSQLFNPYFPLWLSSKEAGTVGNRFGGGKGSLNLARDLAGRLARGTLVGL